MTKKLEDALRYKDDSKLKKLIRQGYNKSNSDLSDLDLTTLFGLKNDVILFVIKYNKNINLSDSQNFSPLCLAVLKREEEIVKKLLKYGANVNFERRVERLINKTHVTALEVAFINRDLKIIKLLIESGADLKEHNIGWIAFKKAILNDDKEVYELLINYQIHMGHSDMSSSILFHAVQANNYELLEKAIKEYNILDVNYSDFTQGKTLLLRAIFKKSYKIVKLLIENGIDINQEFSDGVNSLMLAVNYMLEEKKSTENKKIIELLIDSNININQETDKGFTALMIACKDKNSIANIELLLDKEAKINHQNENGLTALMCSVKERNLDITKLLIDGGADINISNNQGVTPLMLASWQNDIDTIKLLNTAGVNIELKDYDEYVAFDYMSLNFTQKHGLLDVFEKTDKYKNIKDKILKIDTNHGIDETKFIEWIEYSGIRHKPNELVNVLQRFSSEEKLKYINHTWDSTLSYDDFMKDVKNEFYEVSNELKILSPTLYESINEFLFIATAKHISWSSQVVKEEIIKGILPNNIELDTTSQPFKTFGDAIDNFKSLFVVKQNDKKLKLLKKFTKIKKELSLKSIDLSDLKKDKIDKFFTDTKRFEKALTLILKDIQENSSDDKKDIVVEADTIFENGMDMIEIKIIHIDSRSSKTADSLTETIDKNGGNFKSIYNNLLSVCDWSIETICQDDKRYRIDYLYPEIDNSKPHSTRIENEIRGFTHILRFYI